MADSKRVKITLRDAKTGRYTDIDREAIAQSQRAISTVMKVVIREYQKNEVNSKELASKVALNA
jgi:CRISPR/Cas system CMR-associated protein Cmr1 (group 7 of RAMP superfamily)